MKPPSDRHLRWITACALTPLLLLAAVALRSLRSDQEAIEVAARRELGSLSARLASELQRAFTQHDLELSKTIPTDNVRSIHSTSMHRTMDAQGETLDFHYAPDVPTPPGWWREMTQAQRDAYRHFAQKSTPWTEVDAVTAELPETAKALLKLEYHRRQPGASTLSLVPDDRLVLLPSGVSYREAVLWQRIREVSISDSLLTDLVRSYLTKELPGSWPELREVLLTEKGSAKVTPSLVDAIVRQGDLGVAERTRLHALRQQWPVNEWKPGARWILVDAHWFLASLHPASATSTNSSATGNRTSWTLTTTPRETLDALFTDVVRNLAPDTPAYATPRIWWADRTWSAGAVDAWSIAPRPQDNAFKPIHAVASHAESHTSWAGYEIADNALLLAGHRRRAWTLGCLIVGAALISALGFWQMQRGFSRQRRLAEQEANFVSSVSHELRAPVASVGLMVETLQRDVVIAPERRSEYLRLMGRECRRLGQLIQNVLATRRLDQGSSEFNREPLDLSRLVADTAAGFGPLAVEQAVRLEVRSSVQGPWPEILGDSLGLQQALTNLLDNALKHSARGGLIKVDLGLVDAGRRVRLQVTDTGPGVPREDRERIFERFYRRGTELRRETEGIGLGLALVRHTVEAHGGRVWCEAGESDCGARFVVELPITRAVELNT